MTAQMASGMVIETPAVEEASRETIELHCQEVEAQKSAIKAVSRLGGSLMIRLHVEPQIT